MKDTYHYAMIYRKIHRNTRVVIDFNKIIIDDPFYLHPEKAPPDCRYKRYAGRTARKISQLSEAERKLQIKRQAFQIIVRPLGDRYSLLMGLRAYACLKELRAERIKVFICNYPDRKSFEEMLLQSYVISPKKKEGG